MTIGFSNGNFYKLYSNKNDRFKPKFIEYFKANNANAIELHYSNESAIDYLLNVSDLKMLDFDFISIHAPSVAYSNNISSNKILSKLELVSKKLKIDNIVFHPDKIIDWKVFRKYENLPISIENMDNQKDFGRTIKDIKSILDKYPFRLTLDLQHCFVNDYSMKLAVDFQKIFKDRIAEYHLSGSDESFNHHPLYKTKQDEIIDSLKYKNIPIIIESGFDKIGEQEKELEYIRNRIN